MFVNCKSFTSIHIQRMIVMRILMELAFWLTNLKGILKQFSTSLKNYCQNILDHTYVDTGKYSTFVHSVTLDHKFDISMVFSVFIFLFFFTGALWVVADMFFLEVMIITVNKVEPTIYKPLLPGAEIHGHVILVYNEINHYTALSK